MIIRHFLGVVAVLVLLHPSALSAQTTTGSVRGYITDSTKTPVSGAQITAHNVATGGDQGVTSQASGFYMLAGLLPGDYDLTIRRVGMVPQRQIVQVQVGAVLTADFQLSASAVEVEAVTVTAVTTAETHTSEVATNVTSEQINSLPLSDRNFLDLVALAPGTTLQGGGINDTRKTFATGALPADNVNVFIDGASFKNELTAGGVAGQDQSRGNPFPLNAIQEFRVITENYKAEYQKASSGIITATTKSGGNRWDGAAFFYGQGKGLIGVDSLPCTTTPTGCQPHPKPEYSRYQAGASFGGPIVRDRLFFFGSYEGNYQDRANTVAFKANPNVPAGQYPAFDSLNLAQYEGQFTSPFRSTLLFGKLSYVPAPKQSLEVSLNTRHETDIRDFGQPSNATNTYLAANNYLDNVYTAIAKHRYTGTGLLNEATVSFQHFRRNPSPTNPDLVRRTFLDDIACCPSVASLGGAATTQDYTQNRLSFRNDVTHSGMHLAGQHVVKGGANVDLAHYHAIKDNNGNPEFKYFVTDSFAFPREATLGAGNPDFTADNYQVGAYLQDDWSPTRRLIVNLGIRWDYESNMMNNDYVTPQAVRDSLAPFVPANYLTDGTQRPPFYGAFQPRVGFSYAFDERGRTTLFGGYGIYYDRALYDNVAIVEQYALQHPNYNFFFFSDPADSAAGKVRWQDSYLSKEGLQGLLASGRAGKPEILLVANDTKPPMSRQWSAGIRQIVGPVALSMTYTNVRSYHGFTYMCGNQTGATGPGHPPNCFTPPAPTAFGNVFISSDQVRTWYEAVYVKVDKRYTAPSRWGAGLAYTWAKATQIGGDLFSFDYRTPADYPRWPSPNVQRNTVVGNWLVDLPLAIQFSGILNLGSGYPYSTGAPQNRAFPSKQGFVFANTWAFRNMDVRLRKHVTTFAAQGTDITAEVFNVFNFQNLGCWGGNPGTPSCINYGSRRVQLGAGYTF